MALLCTACSATTPKEEETPEVIEPPVVEVEEDVIRSARFIGVGDNLIHSGVYADPMYQASFDAMYEHTNARTQAADIAFLNQETILGGKSIGLSHYPTFNSPWEIGEAVVNAGFDWINHASNHTMDRGVIAIENSLAFWNQYPDVKVTGIYPSQNARDTSVILEQNGMRFGLLSYTYGLNGFSLPSDMPYLVSLIDKEAMKQDIARVKEEVDFVLVAMHWGNEYWTTPSEEQYELANFLNEQGVDVIIGQHPHVIQPVEIIGDEHQSVVAYSLGNFISGQDEPIRMLGGALQLDFYKNETTNETWIENVELIPTFTHYENRGGVWTNFKTYFLEDYDDALLANHYMKKVYPNLSVAEVWGYVDEITGGQYVKRP